MRLCLHAISKKFSGVTALDDVSLEIRAGEVHALCGENGAGKSTLMNIVTGNLAPDAGHLTWEGNMVQFSNPLQAFAQGIAIVYQHLSVIDSLSVAENLFLNRLPVNAWGIVRYTALYERAQRLLNELEIDLDPRMYVSDLSPAQKQMVEIAKALSQNPRLLVLDEPTASLTDRETRRLYNVIRQRRQQGVSIVYISHRLDEIFELADRISVLKDGKFQGTFLRTELTRHQLISKMIGRALPKLPPPPHHSTTPLLQVQRLSGARFRNISFTLHAGEILGMAGLAGAGRTEIARAIFGMDDKSEGEIMMHGHAVNILHPADAIRHRIAYVPEDRKALGIFGQMSLWENIAAASLPEATTGSLFDSKKAIRTVEPWVATLTIACRTLFQQAATLSGGNQQKILLARWLCIAPRVLIVDEPTHGIDVGAKQELYHLLRDLAASGMAILMISSELPELLGLCHRILVIREGGLAGVVNGSEGSEEKILRLATGS